MFSLSRVTMHHNHQHHNQPNLFLVSLRLSEAGATAIQHQSIGNDMNKGNPKSRLLFSLYVFIFFLDLCLPFKSTARVFSYIVSLLLKLEGVRKKCVFERIILELTIYFLNS